MQNHDENDGQESGDDEELSQSDFLGSQLQEEDGDQQDFNDFE